MIMSAAAMIMSQYGTAERGEMVLVRGGGILCPTAGQERAGRGPRWRKAGFTRTGWPYFFSAGGVRGVLEGGTIPLMRM